MNIEGLALHPHTNELFGLASERGGLLFKIDKTTASTILLGTLNPTAPAHGLAFSPTGTLYSIRVFGQVYSIEIPTLETTLVADRVSLGSQGLVFDAKGIIYAIDRRKRSMPELFTLDPLSNDLSVVGSFESTSGFSYSGIEFVVPEPGTLLLVVICALAVIVCKTKHSWRQRLRSAWRV